MNLCVEVLRTNVSHKEDAKPIIQYLGSWFEGAQVSIDLQDIDRVLRIAARYPIDPRQVIVVVRSFGFEAEVLRDTPLSMPPQISNLNSPISNL